MAIKFKMNKQKAIECVLWLIQRGENDMYRIWKMLFAAEKYHLNKYGRPITGDKYLAMQYGTVPQWLYSEASQQPGIGFVRSSNSLFPERKYIDDLFSKSDKEALKKGYDEYAGLDFEGVKIKNHQEPAWIKNWKKRGVKESHPIPFEDLIDEVRLKKELVWRSQTMVI
ncbi:MAG: Panacea domain-containing protein [Fibromonadales bacterium]|nr:Panacea domain-containing protein [Fibromonadales bacterium]